MIPKIKKKKTLFFINNTFIYYNASKSVILKMVNSILSEVPSHLIKYYLYKNQVTSTSKA